MKYLTDEEEKKALKDIIPKALLQARIDAMKLNGYVVEWKDGMVVKVYKDGTIAKLV